MSGGRGSLRIKSGVARILATLVGMSLVSVAWASAVLEPNTASRRTVPARLSVPGLSDRTLAVAMRAYTRARQRGEITRPLLSIIDYALPSTEKRLWVLDLERGRVLFHELVAHGQQSGENEARAFSNDLGSHQSSLGVFRTGAMYKGDHGLSLRLDGLEAGINDRAAERAIVVHGADYVSEKFAARFGRIGRSFGCPAVRPAIADSLIHVIRGGTLVFAFYPDSGYYARSAYAAP